MLPSGGRGADKLTYKELSEILYSQFERDSRTVSTLMMGLVVRLVVSLASLLSLVSCLPAVFDIIPPRTVQPEEVTFRPTFISRRNLHHSRQSNKPCLQLRHKRGHYARCQEKIKRKRLRKCFRAWLEKNGRHRNALLPCLFFRER